MRGRLSHVFLQVKKKSETGCSRYESFLQKEAVVCLVYTLMRSGLVLISENLTTTFWHHKTVFFHLFLLQ